MNFMGEILTALVMIGIALGPFPKNKSFDSFDQSQTTTKFQNTNYPAESIMWASAPGIKKATLTKNGITQTTFYNWQNELVATTQIIDITGLPPAAIQNLIKYFPGYQMGEITQYTGTEVFYFVNLKNEQEDFLVKISPDAQVSYLKALSGM